ncbi:phage tail fiber protein [Pandoraea apista]|uniref:phage tail fiber protein n=1 Tax=Pandoraea apista TaxID=93218 RepID=UPI002F9222FD
MANTNTITAANSIFLLSVGGIFPVAQQLQGFAADAAFAFDSVEPAEVVMGVDGNMSAGYVPYITVQTISIMPDSPSLSIFETWLQATNTTREVFYADAQITLPSIGRKFILSRGVLTSAKTAPDVKKVLGASEFKVSWNTVAPSFV